MDKSTDIVATGANWRPLLVVLLFTQEPHTGSNCSGTHTKGRDGRQSYVDTLGRGEQIRYSRESHTLTDTKKSPTQTHNIMGQNTSPSHQEVQLPLLPLAATQPPPSWSNIPSDSGIPHRVWGSWCWCWERQVGPFWAAQESHRWTWSSTFGRQPDQWSWGRCRRDISAGENGLLALLSLQLLGIDELASAVLSSGRRCCWNWGSVVTAAGDASALFGWAVGRVVASRSSLRWRCQRCSSSHGRRDRASALAGDDSGGDCFQDTLDYVQHTYSNRITEIHANINTG